MGDTKPPARRRWVGRGCAGTHQENPSLRGGQAPSLAWSTWELLAVAAAGLLLLYIALCYQDFHFRVAQVYARLGYPHAQHIVGQRYLQGNLPCQRTIVYREHKRGSAPWALGTVFYILTTTLLLCFHLRSWSGKKQGPGHALVQVRCKKITPDMVHGSFLGKSVGVWEEEKELVILKQGEMCCTIPRRWCVPGPP
ncbi:uncharacterized protein LOC118165793 isoform X1 [Oxyura jamaicensis]|uniref:uncharacterized protein LOC118165793 isoform X1 n=1 Tax=Oxyura jamaicensis TaxID=8884 RepID=UPI0015A5EF58|nr:uncharacterized protein LOC118165793 isoform X1 [Oxyura jamaicensis]